MFSHKPEQLKELVGYLLAEAKKLGLQMPLPSYLRGMVYLSQRAKVRLRPLSKIATSKRA